ncbi:MAG: hypothetical protein AB1772_00030 [Candidatus Zixiibacteriota bacterium]
MRKNLLLVVSIILFAINATGQETYFGKNKVRYRDFDWSYIQTRHFDIYFYEDAYSIAKFSANVLEAAYKEVSDELNYNLQHRVPVFLYNSHNELQQTNIIPNLLSEGIGGFTEPFKNRIAVPFTGSYEDLRHVLHHELTHAVVHNMLFGNNLSSILSRQRFFDLPAWFSEGYAEYSSRHGWDYNSDMFLRDATVNNYLVPPQYLEYNYFAYRQGQAMVKYIADKYGEDKLHKLIQKGKILLTMSKTMKAVLGVEEKDFWDDFSKEMKRRYWPSIASLKEADEIGKQLTKAREDGSYFNEKPAFAPDGDVIAIFTDKSDYTEIVLISPYDGKTIKRLVKAERSGDLESLHAYVSGMSFSPDGENIVFAAKSRGKESLFFVRVADGDVYLKRRFEYQNIVNPAWSPDGRMVAFAALDGDQRDLYVYHIDSDKITQVTNDRYDDVEPSWMPNSAELVFSSDHPHPQNPVIDNVGHPYLISADAYMPGDFDYGMYNIFKVGMDDRRIGPIDVGPGQNHQPMVSPDGTRLAFISNRNGIDNIYVGDLDSTRYFAVTDILTGVRHVSWSPKGDRLVFSAFYQGAFDIFLLENLVPLGENGALAETDFVKGNYDLLGKAITEPAAATGQVTDSTIVNTAMVTGTIAESSTPLAVTDSAAITPGDTLAVADTTRVVEETGIYDDEYVYVGSAADAALDSVLQDVRRDHDSTMTETRRKEPASFDSIPPPLPDGEYSVNKYRPRLTTDFVGGGFSYDTFFGVRGQTIFVFSDYLGNHQVLVATDLVNSLDQSFVQAYYFNNTNRTSLGVGAFHTKNYYEDSYGFIFSDRFYGVQGFASRPFSIFSRLEASVAEVFIDRKYYDRALGDTRPNRSAQITSVTGSYVFDNVLWGYTAPVNGRRFKFTLDGGTDLFDAEGIGFYSAGFDYRKYWHIARTVSMALRFSGGASFGRTPKQYFLGGTTNWIGTRTLEAKVYDVENLYFADVVTPLRGQEYYGISGDRYGLINWELRFPMIQYFAMKYPLPILLSNVTGAVFTDVGAAWFGGKFKGGTSDNGVSRLQDIKAGFGVGMRINLFGFALLRYDVAWSTDLDDVADKPSHYFSFGADF